MQEYRKTVRREDMERRQDIERAAADFTRCGACYACGYVGSPGWLHDADTDERVEPCPVCNNKEGKDAHKP